MLKQEDHTKTWRFQEDKLHGEIKFWGVSQYNPHGIWNYYVSIHETMCTPEQWEQLWLPDTKLRVSPESPLRVTHDYYKCPIANLEWHGGVTFYEKYGHVEKCRAVKFGCDYNHFYDQEYGPYDLSHVENEARNTAREVAAWLQKV